LLHCSSTSREPGAPVAATASSSAGLVTTSSAPSIAPPEVSRVELEEHGLTMSAPTGWSVERGEGWVLTREPSGAAALFLWGVMDSTDGPKMLHLAEEKLAATMPFGGEGKLAPVPSGLRFTVAVEDVPQPDGSVVRVMSLLGASPKHFRETKRIAATGLFGVVRGRATPEVREAVAAAIDSLAPR
jgi:hypothetical protein